MAGNKWPAIDYYVELLSVEGARPYFFGQAKTTSVGRTVGPTHVRLAARRSDILRLLQIPGPTYLFAVHEPTERVFVRSVHTGMPARSITRVSVANELTAANLVKLYNEVRRFWSAAHRKPDQSEFA